MSENSQLEMNGMVPGENEVAPTEEPKKHPDHGAAVVSESAKERKGVVEKLFASFPAAAAQARKEIDATTGEGWHGYESRSVLLQKNASHAPKTASLTDKVRGMFGRR